MILNRHRVWRSPGLQPQSGGSSPAPPLADAVRIGLPPQPPDRNGPLSPPQAGLPSRYGFRVKVAADGRAYLNLGCGACSHPSWNNVDFSLYARLRGHGFLCALLRAAGLFSEERYARLVAIDPDIVAWDLRRGIPYPDQSFDVVYHSHLFEHLDRGDALPFLRECRRVLKVGGMLRIVVPDLEVRIRRYWEAACALRTGRTAVVEAGHERAVVDLFEQMVRTDGVGSAHQTPMIRFLERVLRGDAGAIGERHRWMYDQYSLSRLLERTGFCDIAVKEPTVSGIPGWTRFGLDTGMDGTPHHQNSLYVEAIRPGTDTHTGIHGRS